jgi:hypothetical protein
MPQGLGAIPSAVLKLSGIEATDVTGCPAGGGLMPAEPVAAEGVATVFESFGSCAAGALLLPQLAVSTSAKIGSNFKLNVI